jgi:hypothetical protein
MELIKIPFQPEPFINHRVYREERQKFLEEYYVGKKVVFAVELINFSGSTRHDKGKEAVIRGINCDMFKLEDLDGNEMPGLFSPRVFEFK